MAGTDGFQLLKTVENASLDRFGIGSVPGKCPVETSVVEPAGISCFGNVCFIGVVIQLSDLVTASKYRNSGEGKKQCMKCYVIADSPADTLHISFIIKTLDSCKRCGCSAELRFLGFRIYINFTPGKGIRENTCQEFIQIISVRPFCDKASFQEIIIQIPAYRVAVTEVILEYRCLRKVCSSVDSPAEKGSVLCGNGMPEIGHQLGAVYNVKFRHIGSSAKCSSLCRWAVCFAKEKNSGAYDLTHHSGHTQQRVKLPEIFFRHHRKDTKAEYRSTFICKLQDLKKHCIEISRSLEHTWRTGLWVIHRKT